MEKGMNMENLQKMMDPQNLVRMVRTFIMMGSKELVETAIKGADLTAEGPEYLAVSYNTVF